MTDFTIGKTPETSELNIINSSLDNGSQGGSPEVSAPGGGPNSRIDFVDIYANRTQASPLSDRAAARLRDISDYGRENQKIDEPSAEANPVQTLGGASARSSAQQMSLEPTEDFFRFSQLAGAYLKASRYNQELAFVGSVGGNMTKSIKTLMTSQ
ncbi:MAG: hypothetical protein AAGK71_14530 [Pseudomonadota bacterium]